MTSTRATKRYTVQLTVPTTLWGMVEVEATCEEEAIAKAFAASKAGDIAYESCGGIDTGDAELFSVESEDDGAEAAIKAAEGGDGDGGR